MNILHNDSSIPDIPPSASQSSRAAVQASVDGSKLSVIRIEKAGLPDGTAEQRHRLVVHPDKYLSQSPFLALVEDWVAPPGGFPTHPHRGMETVTLVLQGAVAHRDHTGAHGVLNEGDVGFMTAGAGVLHSEIPGPEGVHLLQLWLNLPAALKFSPAQFTCVRKADAKALTLDGVAIRVYAGDVMGTSLEHGSTWPLTLLDIRLDKSARMDLPLPTGYRAFAFVLDGDVDIGRNNCAISRDRIAWLERSDRSENPVDVIALHARTSTRLLVYASPEIEEPMVMRGPFVMNTPAELDQAYADLQAGCLTEGRPAASHI